MRRKHSKNTKLQKAIAEMTVYVQRMKEKIATEIGKKPKASSEKHRLRSTHNVKGKCATVQMPVDILDEELHSTGMRTRSTNNEKNSNKIGTLIASKSTEKKHNLRSTCTVSDSKSKPALKVSPKRHHKVSEDKDPPQKRARKEVMKSPIATRTRNRIGKYKTDS